MLSLSRFIINSFLFTHVHRYIGSRNGTRQTLSTSPKLTYLSVYDWRNGVTQCIRDV